MNAPVDVHRLPVTADPELLAGQLARRITGEVRFDTGARAAYSADASNYRQIPIGVVIPRSIDDVVATLDICRAHGVPILPRGGGTSQNGQCVNVAVVIDTTKYLNRVLDIDPVTKNGARRTGRRLRCAARRRGKTCADFRPGSGDPQPLHPGRHDRQQTPAARIR